MSSMQFEGILPPPGPVRGSFALQSIPGVDQEDPPLQSGATVLVQEELTALHELNALLELNGGRPEQGAGTRQRGFGAKGVC